MAFTIPPVVRAELPIKVAQFGTGVFLRGHFDWMVQGLNQRGAFCGGIAVVKLTAQGDLASFERQQGAYVHVLRGGSEACPEVSAGVIDCIRAWIDPRLEWQRFAALARQDSLRFVVSNATEAGIVYRPSPPPSAGCPESFPARLAAFLDERRRAYPDGGGGLVVLPLELIADNGPVLRDLVLRHARDWRLDAGFARFVQGECRFVSTLVDRIVAAPRDEDRAQLLREFEVDDALLNASEPYHFLGLETDAALERELPLLEHGFEVVYTADLAPYRLRKVRILNGGHAAMIFTGLLDGLELVQQAMAQPLHADFLEQALLMEVVPTLPLPRADLERYVQQILRRFRNPFLRHRMLDIRLNSLAKVKVRLLPTLVDARRMGLPTPRLTLSFAAFLLDYLLAADARGSVGGPALRGGRPLRDDAAVAAAFARVFPTFAGGAIDRAIGELLSDRTLWGDALDELPELVVAVQRDIDALLRRGVQACLRERLAGAPPSPDLRQSS